MTGPQDGDAEFNQKFWSFIIFAVPYFIGLGVIAWWLIRLWW